MSYFSHFRLHKTNRRMKSMHVKMWVQLPMNTKNFHLNPSKHTCTYKQKAYTKSFYTHSHVWPDQDFWSQCHIWNPTKQLQLVLLFDGMFHFLLNNSSICSTILTLFDVEFLWTKSSIKLIFWFLVENISLSQHEMKIPPIHIYFLNPCLRYWEQFICVRFFFF